MPDPVGVIFNLERCVLESVVQLALACVASVPQISGLILALGHPFAQWNRIAADNTLVDP